jgi:hypothetical protein
MTVRPGVIVLASLLALTVGACSQQPGTGRGKTDAAVPSRDASVRAEGNGAAASCIAPELSTRMNTVPGARARAIVVSPGQTLGVYGFAYQTCDDVNPNLGGPSARPFRDLAVFVVQGQRRLALGTVSAHAPAGSFSVSIRLPADLRPGPAVIRTSELAEVPLRIRVR